MSAVLTADQPAAPAEPTPGLFQQRWPVVSILAAFPLLTLPVAALVAHEPTSALVWTYVWLFGMTHFVVTFAVYLRADNRRYFASTPANRVVFIAVPLVLFVGFDLYHALRLGAQWPVFGLLLLAAVRFADYNHFNRQSFGVIQLFKARAGARSDPRHKKLENWYFGALTALMFVTFAAGGVCPLVLPDGPLTVVAVSGPLFPPILTVAATQWAFAAVAAVATVLFAIATVNLWRATRARGGFGTVFAYLLVQTLSGLLAAAYFPLYLATSAVHYIEYHILMAPRCFRSPIDPACRIDRAFGAVRARPVLFYLVVIAVAGLVTLSARAGMGMMGRDPSSAGEPFRYLALIAVFDGLFMFHYFVEMFIWRFSDPHFRKEMAGLYFAPAK